MTVTVSGCEIIVGCIIYITGLIVGYMYGLRGCGKSHDRMERIYQGTAVRTANWYKNCTS